MNDRPNTPALRGSVVEEEVELTTFELGRASRASEQQIEVWVLEGVLQPSGGDSREAWRFGGESLRRMRMATRLMHDLDINSAGVALALDLLDRISELEARLRR